MKAILVAIAIALGAYGAIGMEAAQQSHSTVQKSLDRMSAVEAALKSEEATAQAVAPPFLAHFAQFQRTGGTMLFIQTPPSGGGHERSRSSH